MSTSGAFEVYARSGGRWQSAEILENRIAAETIARQWLAKDDIEAVKVVDLERAPGARTVFEESVAGLQPVSISTGAVKEAPLCVTLLDCYQFPARSMLNRLLREYLDREKITVFELMHCPGPLGIALADSEVCGPALGRIADLQAAKMKVDRAGRQRALEALCRQVLDHARKTTVYEGLVRDLGERGYARMVAQIDPAGIELTRVLTAQATLAAYLSQWSDWEGKLKAVLGLLRRDFTVQTVDICDELVVEILSFPGALKALLGLQADLGSTVLTMAELVAGQCTATGTGWSGVRADLNAAFARHGLPLTAALFVTRIVNSLNGTARLVDQESAESAPTRFERIIRALAMPGGIRGEARMAEAVVRRARVVFASSHGDLGLDAALDRVLRCLPQDAARLGFLLSYQTAIQVKDAEGTTHIQGKLAGLRDRVSGFEDLFDAPPGRGAMQAALAQLHAAAAPVILSDALADWLARLLESGQAMLSGLPDGAPETPDTASQTPGIRRYKAGNRLFEQGAAGDEVFLIVEGTVEIRRREAENDSVAIAECGPGEIIGELALIGDQPRIAAAIAKTDVMVRIMPRSSFRALLDEIRRDHPVVHTMLLQMAKRLRDDRGAYS